MEKQYVISERAHFMCPNMHFGMLLEIDAVYDSEKAQNVLWQLAEAHPFLRSTIQFENGTKKLYYKVESYSTVQITERIMDTDIWADYAEVGKKEWNVFQNGLLKVYLYPAERSFQVLFIAHHLLGDGRSVLELICAFADAYIDGRKPVYAEEHLIKCIKDLPKNSDLRGISRLLIKWANRRWKKESRNVSYEEYAEFVNHFLDENPMGYEHSIIEKTELDKIKHICKKNGISLNDYLMAKLYFAANTNKIVMGVDIREIIDCYNLGAMGNYASAIGIVCRDRCMDVLEKAKKIHGVSKKNRKNNNKLMCVLACYLNMDADLIDAMVIATLGKFESKAARFVGANIFGFNKRDGISMSNLGSVDNRNIKSALFIPPLSPSAREVIGVLTVNGKMQLTCSYYSKVISAENVKEQMGEMACLSL